MIARALSVKKRILLLFAAVVMLLAGLVSWWFTFDELLTNSLSWLAIHNLPVEGLLRRWYTIDNPPYSYENAQTDAHGAVVAFAPQTDDYWHRRVDIVGLRRHTKDIIYQAVYYGDVYYCFSKSGRVYAMQRSQDWENSVLLQTWNWSGNPHDFPRYDFSDTSPLVYHNPN